MGRRKERRLAAMAAAGRRVKLDLFLDPSPGKLRPPPGPFCSIWSCSTVGCVCPTELRHGLRVEIDPGSLDLIV